MPATLLDSGQAVGGQIDFAALTVGSKSGKTFLQGLKPIECRAANVGAEAPTPPKSEDGEMNSPLQGVSKPGGWPRKPQGMWFPTGLKK